MILMSMCDKEAFYLLFILFQVRNIRDYQINSQHIVLWECESTIHYNNTIFVLKSSNVHSNLFQSAQWNDFEFSCILLLFFVQNKPPVLFLHFKIGIFYQFLKNLYNCFKFHIVFYHFIGGICIIGCNFF